tara:strand:+ start:406 stop:639 length:234 start_codon:yes stop_codon:yes gene_type:complete
MEIPKEIKELMEFYQITFESDNGKKVLEDLENRFHIHSSTMDDTNNNLAYREGQRSVILFIKKILKGVTNGRRKPGS